MLNGRLAWVTGAGGGIGQAMCKVLAREGATVIADDVNPETSREALKVCYLLQEVLFQLLGKGVNGVVFSVRRT